MSRRGATLSPRRVTSSLSTGAELPLYAGVDRDDARSMHPQLSLGAVDFPLSPDEPFTTAMARQAGLSRQQIHRLVHHKLVRTPMKGLHIPSHLDDTLDLRCAAMRLVMPPDSFAADRTAAYLHGATGALAPNEDLEVPPPTCFRLPTRTRLRNDLVTSGRRDVRADELTEVQGIPVTTQLRTALDLGRLQRTRDLRLAGMDAMLALGGFCLDDLLAEIPRFKGQRGVVALRVLAPLADGGSQSFGESALRLRWYDAGLPRPETQVEIVRPDGRSFFIDLGIEAERFGAEYDGEAPHSAPDQVDHDIKRRKWLRDADSWWLVVCRRENVFGRLQDSERLLRDGWARARGRRISVLI